MKKRQGMFDMTPLPYACSILFLAYFVTLPLALWAFGASTWSWTALIFPVLAALLVIDLSRRLRERRITATQVVGHRAAGVFMVGDAFFGVSGGLSWFVPIVTIALAAVLFVLPKRNALPSETSSSDSAPVLPRPNQEA